MRAILTKYIGPSNTRGSRYKADAGDGGTLTLSADDSLNSEANHAAVAKALRDKMKWSGSMVGGGTPTGMCWVFTNTYNRID